MKVGTQQDDHLPGTGTKALTDIGQPIDNIAIIASALNPPYISCCISI